MGRTFTPLETIAGMLAAVGHDIDHPVSYDFLGVQHTKMPMAIHSERGSTTTSL